MTFRVEGFCARLAAQQALAYCRAARERGEVERTAASVVAALEVGGIR
jgi:hypothetical protein